jgi:hypothetical protein
MFEIDNISLFVFIFSLLGVLRVFVNFLTSVFRNPPQMLVMSKLDIILFGLFLSYTITYLLN